MKISDKHCEELIEVLDADGDGNVDFDEFKSILTADVEGSKETNAAPEIGSQKVFKVLQRAMKSQRKLYGHILADAKSAFEAMDLDGSGALDHGEFKQALQRLGLGVTDAQCDMMIEEIDANGDGEIDYDEFMSMIRMGGKRKKAPQKAPQRPVPKPHKPIGASRSTFVDSGVSRHCGEHGGDAGRIERRAKPMSAKKKRGQPGKPSPARSNSTAATTPPRSSALRTGSTPPRNSARGTVTRQRAEPVQPTLPPENELPEVRASTLTVNFAGNLALLGESEREQFKTQVKEGIAESSDDIMVEDILSIQLSAGSIIATATLDSTVPKAAVDETACTMNECPVEVTLTTGPFAGKPFTARGVDVAHVVTVVKFTLHEGAAKRGTPRNDDGQSRAEKSRGGEETQEEFETEDDTNEVQAWLQDLNLSQYWSIFKDDGWGELELVSEMDGEDFKSLGITKKAHLLKLDKAAALL